MTENLTVLSIFSIFSFQKKINMYDLISKVFSFAKSKQKNRQKVGRKLDENWTRIGRELDEKELKNIW